ncbi:GNAT family N-acetyltransferase [Lentisphaera profundi]|uniref:GNAT family N-acetyltransferase n=1 Tax=Lentisphaera profundi TaxID=1658616 RepID=A0ABY7VP28_9BACT|nr:GNAT family N-acetyltransferase [Lentisphaera profundi]WDE95913.1 GNAT family N-acetyltransferase [Lentisphaera profundi]
MKIKTISPNNKHFESVCFHLTLWIHQEFDYFLYLQLKWDLIDQYQLAKTRHKKKRSRNHFPKIIIATHKGDLIGFCRLVAEVLPEQKKIGPWLSQMYILETQRSKGYGTKIIEYVGLVAKKLKYKTLYLRTEDQEKFYQKLDWQFFEKHSENDTEFTVLKKNL